MRRRAPLAVVFVAGVLAPITAGAQLTCEPHSSPLLEVTSYFRQRMVVEPIPSSIPEVRSAWLLCNDRRLLSWSITSQAPEPPQFAPVPVFPYAEARVSLDTVEFDAFSTLQAAMQEAHIGQLTDCLADLDPRFFAAGVKVTWHGRGTRRNTFFINAGNASAPCPSAATDLARTLALPGLLAVDLGGSEVVIQ